MYELHVGETDHVKITHGVKWIVCNHTWKQQIMYKSHVGKTKSCKIYTWKETNHLCKTRGKKPIVYKAYIKKLSVKITHSKENHLRKQRTKRNGHTEINDSFVSPHAQRKVHVTSLCTKADFQRVKGSKTVSPRCLLLMSNTYSSFSWADRKKSRQIIVLALQFMLCLRAWPEGVL